MSKEIIYSPAAPEPIGPYSQAVRFGNQLYVSGQIAIDRSTGLIVSKSIEEETRQVLSNLSEVLRAGGMGFEHVVKCTIFLTDMNDFPVVNKIYGEYFTTNPPARETVEVRRLPKDVRVEISCIAIK
ncbi:MAG: RidA family protein [Cyclobacteriaceae bacterium]|jgi:2-iminobutanoate/2-iminopropanoate deaminase